jgi:capsule polysaccharide export protein KpsE/RkpR
LQEYEEEDPNSKENLLHIIEYLEKTIIDLKIQLEEVIRSQLNEKEEIVKKIEAKVVFLRKELEKTIDQLKFGKSTKILDDILNCQRSPSDKTELGYNQDQKTSNEASRSIV